MAEAVGQRDKLNVFISYSRDDLQFADQLDAALGLAGVADIPSTVKAFLPARIGKPASALSSGTPILSFFVLSPSSARSKTCAWEVEEAVRLGKRILPVLCRSLDDASPPPQLAKLRLASTSTMSRDSPGAGFGKGLVDLASALNTDLDWLREHTRYLQRATEWDGGGRLSNRLLSGPDIASAKAWAARRPQQRAGPNRAAARFHQGERGRGHPPPECGSPKAAGNRQGVRPRRRLASGARRSARRGARQSVTSPRLLSSAPTGR